MQSDAIIHNCVPILCRQHLENSGKSAVSALTHEERVKITSRPITLDEAEGTRKNGDHSCRHHENKDK